MIEDSTTWYLGTVGEGTSYKLAKYTGETGTSLNSSTTTSKVGLLRLGELGAGQYEKYKESGNTTGLTTNYWILTSYDTYSVRYMRDSGYMDYDSRPANASGVLPSLNLKSNVVITGGDGTKNNPFTLS